MPTNKTCTILNHTGNPLHNVTLSHTWTMTSGSGWNVINHKGILAPGETASGVTSVREGVDDYWYLTCNILIPVGRWPNLQNYDASKLVDGMIPVALSNSKGWKQVNLLESDTGAQFDLVFTEANSWWDITLTDKIIPSHTHGDDHWLKVAGFGGEAPTQALFYPVGAAVLGAVLVLPVLLVALGYTGCCVAVGESGAELVAVL